MKDFLLEFLAPKPIHLPSNPFVGVTMMVGDSIGNMVAMEISPTIINRCQPGDRARDAWIRFPYDHRLGDLLIIQHGTNDLPDRDPVEYIEKMAHIAWSEGRRLVFTGIASRDGFDVSGYNFRIMELANEFSAPFADWGNVPITRPDGLHPDGPSVRLLADATQAAILLARK